MSFTRVLWSTVVVLGVTTAAAGADALPGPVSAEVTRVIDGDTIEVRARVWLGQFVETRVRLADIDAPELRGDCAGETALAERAQALLAHLLAAGPVTLRDIRYGTYAGRVVARIETASGDVAAALLADGVARPYAGRGPRPDWCGG